MSLLDDLTLRNAAFATDRFEAGLRMMPLLRVIVIGCVDPRVDPSAVLGLADGEAAVVRNIGGRVTPDVLAQLEVLAKVAEAGGGRLGSGWEIVVLQHTDCGITRLPETDPSLTAVFGSDPSSRSVADPRAAVALDVALLRETAQLEGVAVSGLVYDVENGLVEAV